MTEANTAGATRRRKQDAAHPPVGRSRDAALVWGRAPGTDARDSSVRRYRDVAQLAQRVEDATRLAPVIDALGTPDFERALLEIAQRHAGVEHCAIFRFNGAALSLIGAASEDGSDHALRQSARYANEGYWQRDPTLIAARQRQPVAATPAAPLILRLDPKRVHDRQFRDEIYLKTHVTERVFVCGERGGWHYGVSLVRTSKTGWFSREQLTRLEQVSGFILSLAAKHAEILATRGGQVGEELASVDSIAQRVVSLFPSLTPREREVCARVLYGLTTQGIALDLGIRAESVATYRKRAYRRLGLGSRHELLRRYLAALSPAP